MSESKKIDREKTAAVMAEVLPSKPGRSSWLTSRFTTGSSALARSEDVPARANRARGGPRTSTRIPIYWVTFFLMVVLPSIASTVYFAWLASDQFLVEARFAVRNSAGFNISTGMARGAEEAKGANSALQAGGIPSLATQDAHIVAQYLRSRAAVEKISQNINIHEIFTRPGIDFWARLPKNASKEDLEEYWKGMVRSSVDGPSGIVSLHVRSFREQDRCASPRPCSRARNG
jgi:capsular polysaccharide transport system permease protein